VPPAVGAAAWLPAGELAGERRGSPRLRRISKHHADLEAVFLATSRTRHVWATSRPLRGAAPPGHPGAATLGQPTISTPHSCANYWTQKSVLTRSLTRRRATTTIASLLLALSRTWHCPDRQPADIESEYGLSESHSWRAEPPELLAICESHRLARTLAAPAWPLQPGRNARNWQRMGQGLERTIVGGVPMRMFGAVGDSLITEIEGLRWAPAGHAPSCRRPQSGRPVGLRRLRNPRKGRSGFLAGESGCPGRVVPLGGTVVSTSVT